ncbi:methionyl-tRNA formyltransferase [Geitlerinema sp. P-1104]|uniref:methionyl-tRNA formyltransferase n=1 Tax=Geitlerinema sp. P-1104 TaxID=2546230 RepID=UPI001476F11F|nr:methionyl-tRNA formyltransferase [Geitlerinema sp. P-1104]NMG58452.1 methionyl-tRNA formyltransferase [Geitlerinema sp. P-1104]
MNLIFLGTPQFAVPSLKTLIEHPEFEVSAVVTQPDKRRGRGKTLIPSPVKTVAVEAGIPVWQPQKIKKDDETLDKLRKSQADFFVVVAYGQILSQEILDMPRLGCINGHGSLLPKYRGAAPIQWCLYHGETQTGMTTMQMDVGMDTGAMLLKSSLDIHLLDNAWDVAAHLAQDCGSLLVETLQGLEARTLQATPQNDEAATYARLIEKSDYELDWTRPAIALHNQVRGFYPNAVTQFRGQSLKVKATIPVGEPYYDQLPDPLVSQLRSSLNPESGEPGQVVQIIKNLGPVVQTREGCLLLQEVQLAGKKTQSGWDFANGTRLEPGKL